MCVLDVCVQVGVQVCSPIWKTEVHHINVSSSIVFVRPGLSVNLEFIMLASLAGLPAPVCIPSAGLSDVHYHSELAFYCRAVSLVLLKYLVCFWVLTQMLDPHESPHN